MVREVRKEPGDSEVGGEVLVLGGGGVDMIVFGCVFAWVGAGTLIVLFFGDAMWMVMIRVADAGLFQCCRQCRVRAVCCSFR